MGRQPVVVLSRRHVADSRGLQKFHRDLSIDTGWATRFSVFRVQCGATRRIASHADGGRATFYSLGSRRYLEEFPKLTQGDKQECPACLVESPS